MHPNDGRVVSNLIVQALKNEDITIYGDGRETRSFCYVDDMIEGILRMMDSEDDFTGPVNLGYPIEFKILELAERIISLAEFKSKIRFLPLPSDDPKQRQPDISLAKEKLEGEPRTQIREGLIKTIDYFRQVISN